MAPESTTHSPLARSCQRERGGAGGGRGCGARREGGMQAGRQAMEEAGKRLVEV